MRKRKSVAEPAVNLVPVEPEPAGPVLPATEVLRRNLLYRMLGAVTGDDMEAIVNKQKEKALNGDARSAKLLMDMVGAFGSSAGPQPSVNVNQTTIVGHQVDPAFMSGLQRNIVCVLIALKNEPCTEGLLAVHTRALCTDVEKALERPEWFVRKGAKWMLTEKAIVEVGG